MTAIADLPSFMRTRSHHSPLAGESDGVFASENPARPGGGQKKGKNRTLLVFNPHHRNRQDRLIHPRPTALKEHLADVTAKCIPEDHRVVTLLSTRAIRAILSSYDDQIVRTELGCACTHI